MTVLTPQPWTVYLGDRGCDDGHDLVLWVGPGPCWFCGGSGRERWS